MTNRIQDKLLEIGRFGCYFLCLLKIAEVVTLEPSDIVAAYDEMLHEGFMKRNCFIVNPKGILEKLTDKFCIYKPIDTDYNGGEYDFTIKRYSLVYGGQKQTHFVLYDADGKELLDPAPDSKIKANGKVDASRCFSFGK